MDNSLRELNKLTPETSCFSCVAGFLCPQPFALFSSTGAGVHVDEAEADVHVVEVVDVIGGKYSEQKCFMV